MTARIAIIAAIGLLLAAFVNPGDPIPGVEVGLEHDPEGLVSPRTTDDLGRAEFAVGEGRAVVLIPAVQTLRRPAVARVEVGRTVQVSAPIMPGDRGRADILGTDGRRLVVVVPRGGGRIRVTLIEAGSRTSALPATGGASGSETGGARATVNSSGGPIDVESWSWGRIDRVNTVQACAARGGDVVMHEGVQQCRLPATARREDPNRAMGSESTTR